MSEQELEEQVEGSEVDETQTEDTGEETGTPDVPKKNKSNWKAMSEALKAERLAREEAQAELEEWRNLNPDIDVSKLKKSDGTDKADMALFLVTNPDAKEHLDKVKDFAKETGFDLEKSWKYVKPTIPVESKSESDFNIKGKTTTKVDVSKLSIEEIYSGEYSDAQKREWRRLRSGE